MEQPCLHAVMPRHCVVKLHQADVRSRVVGTHHGDPHCLHNAAEPIVICSDNRAQVREPGLVVNADIEQDGYAAVVGQLSV